MFVVFSIHAVVCFCTRFFVLLLLFVALFVLYLYMIVSFVLNNDDGFGFFFVAVATMRVAMGVGFRVAFD